MPGAFCKWAAFGHHCPAWPAASGPRLSAGMAPCGASPTPRLAGVRMQSRSPLLALLAAIVLITSLPASRTLAAEPRNATLAPLPAVDTDDGRFGMVQGMVQPDLAWQAGARWDRIIFPWSLIQRDGPNS